MPSKHNKLETIADGPNALQVQPTSDWNADHSIAIPGSIFTGLDRQDFGWDILPAMIGPYQWSLTRMAGNAAPSIVGITGTVGGTAAGPAYATTSLHTRQQRSTYLSAASANAGCGFNQSSTPYVVRSTTANRGGFFFHARFGIDTNLGGASGRLFVGLGSTSAGVAEDPSTRTGDFIGIAYDAADTHLRLMSRDNVATQNLDLGATVPKTDGLMYDVYLYCPAGGAAIYYRIDISNANTFTARVIEGNTATNLPRTDIPLFQRVQGGTSTTTQVTLGIAHVYTAWISN